MPPVAVSMPLAACMPPTSSGLVSLLTSITLLPSAVQLSASLAVKTTLPEAAPGTAGLPMANRLSLSSSPGMAGSMTG